MRYFEALLIIALISAAAIISTQAEPEEILSLGKPTFANNLIWRTKPSSAADGNTNQRSTKLCTLTKRSHENFWKVDLGAVHKITRLQIYTRAGFRARQFRDVDIMLGDENEKYVVCNHVKKNRVRRGPVHVMCEGSGRYVKLEQKAPPGKRERLQLCEVDVFGPVDMEKLKAGQEAARAAEEAKKAAEEAAKKAAEEEAKKKAAAEIAALNSTPEEAQKKLDEEIKQGNAKGYVQSRLKVYCNHRPATTMPLFSHKLTSADKELVLKDHNDLRKNLANLPPLKWSNFLAWQAKIMNHRHGCGDIKHSCYIVGENIFLGDKSLCTTPHDCLHTSFAAWKKEDRFYNYSNHTCTDVCGHYTQLVWRATSEVGCDVMQCYNATWKVTCQYLSPGNRGGKPY